MMQHPIPQQIASYEFKLVGSMTLKQFLKAAAGIVIALLIKPTHMVFFIKWPLMAISAIGGIMLAFVPFQDRPLETWIVAFLRSIYSPTIYLYKKRGDKNWLDVDLGKAVEEKKETEEPLPAKDEGKVGEFILSLPSVKKERQKEITNDPAKGGQANSNNSTITNVQKQAAVWPQTETKEEVEIVGSGQGTVDLQLKTQRLGATGQAVFGSIPMPDPPETPNTLVGMVTNKEGKIMDEAIVEIQDGEGNPVRVLKTNALGQFKTASPLANGKYLVITEREGADFDRVNVEMRGAIVDPIRIIATA